METYLGVESALQKMFLTSRIVGDKWPDYLYHLDDLLNYEGIKIVVIYRDCRNVANSTLKMVQTKWRNQSWINLLDNLEKIGKRWVQGIEIMERHSSRIHIIRYENLITHPKQELKKLGQWLGVPPEGLPAHLITPQNPEKYKDGLSEDQVNRLLEICRPTMKRLGYL